MDTSTSELCPTDKWKPVTVRQLNMSKNFAPEWGPQQAIAEVLANWNDALPFEAVPERRDERTVDARSADAEHGTILLERGSFTFVNRDVVPPAGYDMLVIGRSVKGGKPSHGRFGEGLKAAIAIAHRRGGRVVISALMDHGARTAGGEPMLEPRRWTSFENDEGVLCIKDEPFPEFGESRRLSIEVAIPSLEPADFSMSELVATQGERATPEDPCKIVDREAGVIIVNGCVLPERSTALAAYSFVENLDRQLVTRARRSANPVNLAKYIADAWAAAIDRDPEMVAELGDLISDTWAFKLEHAALPHLPEAVRSRLRAHFEDSDGGMLCFDSPCGHFDRDMQSKLHVIPDNLVGLYSKDVVPTKDELYATLKKRLVDSPPAKLPGNIVRTLETLGLAVRAVRAGTDGLRKARDEAGWVVNVDAIPQFDKAEPTVVFAALMNMSVVDPNSPKVRFAMISRWLRSVDDAGEGDAGEGGAAGQKRPADATVEVLRPTKRRRTSATAARVTIKVHGECDVTVVRE